MLHFHDVKVDQNKIAIYSKENVRLQRSQYISVANTNIESDEIEGKYLEPIDLKYCLPQEVNKKM